MREDLRADGPAVLPAEDGTAGNDNGWPTDNHAFPRFIDFLCNPLESIDPRAVTAIQGAARRIWPRISCWHGVREFHVLLTSGYQFPVGPGDDTTQPFYANVHLDRRCFGWLYPAANTASITSSNVTGTPALCPQRRHLLGQ
jgi:hypothetical protein